MDIHFSRVGHHYIQALFAVTLTLYLLVWCLRHGSRLAAVGAGILLSVDIQVYYAGRVAYAIVPLVIVYVLLVSDRALLRSRLPLLGWLALGWIVGIAPVGVVILGDWVTFMSRTNDVLALGPSAQGHMFSIYGTLDTFYILRTQLWRVLQTFNYLGDSSFQYGIRHPMLDPVSAALFPAAAAYAIFRLQRAGFAICLIALVSVIVIGGVLTIDPPFWPRLIVLAPLLALAIGAFLDALWGVFDHIPRFTIPSLIAALALLVAIGKGNYDWYFNEFEPHVHASFLAAPMDLGNYLRPITDHPYVYGITDGGLYVDHQAVQLLVPDLRSCNVLQGLDLSQCQGTPGNDIIFVVVPARRSLLPELEHMYPGGTQHVLRTYDFGGQIVIYRIQRGPHHQ
jgi:hypothetical protein